MGRVVRGSVVPVLISIAAPLCAIWFALPAKPIDGAVLAGESTTGFVELTLDRIQPLPWVFKDDNDKIVSRFALGWIGRRALLLEAGLELPTDMHVRGGLSKLSNEPKTWVNANPRLKAICYETVLYVGEADDRKLGSLGGIVGTFAMVGFWLYRLRRARRAKTVGVVGAGAAGRSPLGVLLDTARPRSDELIAMVLRRHTRLRFTLYVVGYSLFVMLAASCTADLFRWELSSARHVALFALGLVVGAPVVGLPLFWWMRKRREEIRRVVRNGELIAGMIHASSSTRPDRARAIFGSTPVSTHLFITTSLGVIFQCVIAGAADWAEPGTAVRVLTASDEVFALIIAPAGTTFAARAQGRRRRTGKARGLPSVRLIIKSRDAEPARSEQS